MSYYEEKLNQILNDEYQKKAYLSNKSTVVLAGPGSGKTTVLTLKMKRLLDNYISASRGLACMTFTKEAAKEFTERLSKITNVNNNVFLGTVHSFSLKEIILPFGEIFNDKIPFPISLISKDEKIKALLNIKKDVEDNNELNLDWINEKNISTLTDSLRSLDVNGISKVKNDINKDVKLIADMYEEYLLKNKKVDYVMLVKYAMDLVQKEDYVRKCLEAKFPWILVDEYQDLGRPIQEMILCLMKNTNIKFFVVGDSDQSIYSFQGARPDYLNELYELQEVESIKLINNYRSKKSIIEGSALVLNKNRNYVAKGNFKNDAEYFFYTCNFGLEDQYDIIGKSIIPKCLGEGIKEHEIAVLVSSNDDAENLGKVLDSCGICYYISKHKYERTDLVVWIEEMAKWTVDNFNNLFDNLYDYWRVNFIEYLEERDSDIYYRKKLYDILGKGNLYKNSFKDWIEFLDSKLEIKKHLQNNNDKDELKNFEKLLKESLEGSLKNSSVEDFSKEGYPLNQVVISTRHSSKGLEFEVVILVGLEDGNFPKYAVYNTKIDERTRKTIMEEERRICFVCISRAKSKCYLLNSRKIGATNKKGEGWWADKNPSVFFRELYSKFGTINNTFYIQND